MLIVSRTHQTFARLTFNVGPGGSVSLPVRVDWETWPQILIDNGAELSAVTEKWMDEYGTNIHDASPSSYFEDEVDLRPSHRQSRTSHLFQEDDIYARHDELAMDDGYASYFEITDREER